MLCSNTPSHPAVASGPLHSLLSVKSYSSGAQIWLNACGAIPQFLPGRLVGFGPEPLRVNPARQPSPGPRRSVRPSDRRHSRPRGLGAFWSGLLWLIILGTLPFRAPASDFPYDLPPINYSDEQLDDPISRLQAAWNQSPPQLEWESGRGYLNSVLQALRVSAQSQTLVFSKTSLQRDYISPASPRAIYFNDDVYVGFVPGAPVLEFSAVDSQKGAIFYTLDQQPGDPPRFRRQTHECLQCHDSSLAQGVPGHILRSVYTDPRGQPILSAGTFVTTPASPLRERFGGWYVTGTHGQQWHMGNLIVRSPEFHQRPDRLDLSSTGNQTSLDAFCSTALFPTGHSDIVALQVLAHQVYVHNLITKANHQSRLALRDQVAINQALGRAPTEPLDSTRSRLRSVGEPLLRAVLLADEPAWSAPLRGTSQFAAEFARPGPRDQQGRSLRDLDLQTRLLKHRCSWLIYSPAFLALPDAQLDYLAGRMWEVLNGTDTSGKFAQLSAADRQAVLEIVRETHPPLRERWAKLGNN